MYLTCNSNAHAISQNCKFLPFHTLLTLLKIANESYFHLHCNREGITFDLCDTETPSSEANFLSSGNEKFGTFDNSKPQSLILT